MNVMPPAVRSQLQLDAYAPVHYYSPKVADWRRYKRLSPIESRRVALLLAVRIYRQLRARKPNAVAQTALLIRVQNFLPPVVRVSA